MRNNDTCCLLSLCRLLSNVFKRLPCVAAIKTGRYTHEKKTMNIKEVKQLEQAERAALPREPSPDMVALLSKLPVQINENKYEKVIEHILAAYQEQTMHTVNFFTNIKEKEATYLASGVCSDIFLCVTC